MMIIIKLKRNTTKRQPNTKSAGPYKTVWEEW